MAEPEQGGAAAFIRDAPTRVVLEIVRRLPARSAIRLRAVCKPWRDITSHPALLAVLHRIQPLQPLLCFGRAASTNRYIQLRDYCVEALDLRSDKPRSIFRFTDNTYLYPGELAGGDDVAPINDFRVDYSAYEEYDEDELFMPQLTVHASLDGLLVVSFLHSWYVCNPATRQWAPLPDLSYHDVIGFYEHVSSGEYRVMYQICKSAWHLSTDYYVLTVGSRLSRIIGCPISPAAAEDMGLDMGLQPASFFPPVQLRCNLHWPPQKGQGYNILVFDTEAEMFNWMRPPVKDKDKDMRLLEIHGKLALSVSRRNTETLELWRLEDYHNEIWVQVFRIQLAVAQMTDLRGQIWFSAVVSPEGDVLIECPYRVLHCDRNGNLLQKFQFPDGLVSARHALRDSLLTHAFFRAPKWRNAVEPAFYTGL